MRTRTPFFGPKPSFLPENELVTERQMKHYEFVESYINPLKRAREYMNLMKEEGLTQCKLAKKLGISRARVTQILNLLKLPEEEQKILLKHGKDKRITERALRSQIPEAG